MKITKDMVVSVQYKLSDAQNNVIEDDGEPMVYLHGGYENTFDEIENALDGQAMGYSTSVQIEPEDAFGDYDAELVRIEPLEKFPEGIQVGMQFEGMPDDDAEQEAAIFAVTDIAEDRVILDGNHPLAGMAIRFEMEVVGIRPATDQELAQQYPQEWGEDYEADEDDHYRGCIIQ